MKKLFNAHIKTLQENAEGIMDELNLSGLVIGSGNAQYYFEDDQESPYRPNHHFSHWCPLRSESNFVVIRKGEKPQLLAFIPEDFWHEHKPVDGLFWSDAFDIVNFANTKAAWEYLSEKCAGFAYHGPENSEAQKQGLETNSKGLLPRLDWYRSFKTPYEVACLEEATRLAADGHTAAKAAFEMGESELGIHHAYLVSSRMRDQDLPYESIVCLNEKGAFLHYKDKRDDVRDGKVLLIDAGCNYNGYASDITRTFASESAPKEFKKLLRDMEKMQIKLTKMPKLGMPMGELHWQSHIGLAEILIDNGILKNIEVEDAVKEGLTNDFYPHGIGHMLGILVHDVAGKQVNAAGDAGEPDPRFPKLRTLKPLELGHYFTIEPGLYFIDILLEKRKTAKHADKYNWKLIDKLKPCGGIRIEDNILMTKSGPRNITREYLKI